SNTEGNKQDTQSGDKIKAHWGILFIAFGIGPVVTRTSDYLPLLRNIIGFLLGAIVAYLSPVISESSASET
ncbi:MAG: hypothetical protein F6J98_18285, partial [Moorea sp. SIO4G2]|nr:hypothetical protein [Moorena sp. SIO4G2]